MALNSIGNSIDLSADRFTDTSDEPDASAIRILNIADEEQEGVIDVEFHDLFLIFLVVRHTASTAVALRCRSCDRRRESLTSMIEFTLRRELDASVLVVRRNAEVLTRGHTGQRVATSREETFESGALHYGLHGQSHAEVHFGNGQLHVLNWQISEGGVH